jgi:hypothetical protein
MTPTVNYSPNTTLSTAAEPLASKQNFPKSPMSTTTTSYELGPIDRPKKVFPDCLQGYITFDQW